MRRRSFTPLTAGTAAALAFPPTRRSRGEASMPLAKSRKTTKQEANQ